MKIDDLSLKLDLDNIDYLMTGAEEYIKTWIESYLKETETKELGEEWLEECLFHVEKSYKDWEKIRLIRNLTVELMDKFDKIDNVNLQENIEHRNEIIKIFRK